MINLWPDFHLPKMKVTFSPQVLSYQRDLCKSPLQTKPPPSLVTATASPLGKERSQPEVVVMSSGANNVKPILTSHLG